MIQTLRVPFDISTLAVPGRKRAYELTRAMIESVKHGAHHFVSAGEIDVTEIVSQSQPDGPALKQIAIRDGRNFEGWRKVE